MSCSSFLVNASDNPLIDCIRAGNVEGVRTQLEKWFMPEAKLFQDALVLVSEVNEFVLKSQVPPSKYWAAAQVLLSAPLLYLSGNVVKKAYDQTPGWISFRQYPHKFYNAELNIPAASLHSVAQPNYLLAALSGYMLAMSARSFVSGLYGLFSNKNPAYRDALAIKSLVFDALKRRNILGSATQNSHVYLQ